MDTYFQQKILNYNPLNIGVHNFYVLSLSNFPGESDPPSTLSKSDLVGMDFHGSKFFSEMIYIHVNEIRLSVLIPNLICMYYLVLKIQLQVVKIEK